MDLEAEVRSFVREIEGTLKQAETDIRRVTQELEQQAGRKTDEMQPQVKRTIAEAIRKTITELEKIEARLRS
jgi:F0F1-type ATP synthase membrane subunit b/b'